MLLHQASAISANIELSLAWTNVQSLSCFGSLLPLAPLSSPLPWSFFALVSENITKSGKSEGQWRHEPAEPCSHRRFHHLSRAAGCWTYSRIPLQGQRKAKATMHLSARKADDAHRVMNGETPGAASFGRVMGLVSLAVLFVPCFIFVLLWLVRNWGWWRLKRGKGTRQFIKTWHGWEEREKYEQNLRRRGYHNICGGKVTSAHIVQISWTPEGSMTKHTLQHRGPALEWLYGCFGLRKNNDHSAGRSADIEMGVIPEPPTIHITEASAPNTVQSRRYLRPISVEQLDGPSDIGTITTARVTSDGLRNSTGGVDSGDTVRRRRRSSSDRIIWQANSSETSRATVTQFITPVHDIRTPIWADRLFGIGSSWDTTTTLSSRKTSGNQPLQASPPCTLDPTLRDPHSRNPVEARRAVRSSPAFSPALTIGLLGGLPSSNQLSTRINLENLSTYLESSSRHSRFGSLTSGRPLPFESTNPHATSPITRSQSLTRRFKARARPPVASLFPNVRRQFSEDRERDDLHKEPQLVEHAVISIDNDLQDYEIEESLDGVSSYCEDIQPYTAPMTVTSIAGAGDSGSHSSKSQASITTNHGSSDSRGPLDSIMNLNRLPTSADSSYPSVALQAPSSPPTAPRQCTSPIAGTNLGDPLTLQLLPRQQTLRTSFIPSISLKVSENRSSSQTKLSPLSAAEQAHKDEFRQRLQWLDLRCTVNKRGHAGLDAMRGYTIGSAVPESGQQTPKGKQGLRRVGRSDLVKIGGAGGKENGCMNDIGCGTMRRRSGKVSDLWPLSPVMFFGV